MFIRGIAWGALLALVTPALAYADCANEGDYLTSVKGNTVKVGPLSTSSSRRCGGGFELLRQNVADNTVVSIGAACDASSGQFIDECVSPGQYRYGYAEPYSCSVANCGSVRLYTLVTVSDALAVSCTRSVTSPPAATQSAVPWQPGDPATTSFKTCGSNGGCGVATGARQSVRWFELLALMVGLSLVVLRSRRSRASY